MTAFIEDFRKMMGWCPNVTMNSNFIMQRETEIPDMAIYSKPPLLKPIILKNAYVEGLTREAIIGISLALIFFIFYFSRSSPFFNSYSAHLTLLSVVLFKFALSKATVEINDGYISVKTIFRSLLGLTKHPLTDVDSVEVRKNNESRLVYFFSLLAGMLWLSIFSMDLMRGAHPADTIRSLIWIVVSFGFGYQKYLSSKSMSNIQIRFLSHPSINSMTIYTNNAGQIADMIEKVRANYHGDKK